MRYSTESGFFELNSFPGCNQLVVSSHSFVEMDERGKGRGTLAATDRINLARELGYDYALATVNQDNEPQLRIMEKLGWTKLAEFENRTTGHVIGIYGKDLA